MEIISGQQKDKASRRIGHEFNLCPFGSPQFFQLLGNRCSGVGKVTQSFGVTGFSKKKLFRPALAASLPSLVLFPNKKASFLMNTPVPELCLQWPRAGLFAQLPVQLLGSKEWHLEGWSRAALLHARPREGIQELKTHRKRFSLFALSPAPLGAVTQE